MSASRIAIAVFVKTPNHSPLKTRLAKGLGTARSQEFYRLSVAAVEQTVVEAAKLTHAVPYWAVAEESAESDPLWQRFARVAQGTGGLGDRLHHVQRQLFQEHDMVIMLGADSPQISPDVFQRAIAWLLEQQAKPSHVLGRSHDGGFYILASNRLLPSEAWQAVPTSEAHTAQALVEQLKKRGSVYELNRLTDVDEASDLANLQEELATLNAPSTAQVQLMNWIEQLDFFESP